jgi:hypothetical protein
MNQIMDIANHNNIVNNYAVNMNHAYTQHGLNPQMIQHIVEQAMGRYACSSDLLKVNTSGSPITKQEEASSMISEVIERITEDIKNYVSYFDVDYTISTNQRRDGTYSDELLNHTSKVTDSHATKYFTSVLRERNFSVSKKSLDICSSEAGKLIAKYQDKLRYINQKTNDTKLLLSAPDDALFVNNHLAKYDKMSTEELYTELDAAKKNQILYKITEFDIQYKLQKKTAYLTVLESLRDYFTR